MDLLYQTVTISGYNEKTLLAWLSAATEATKSASALIESGTSFASRDTCDNRKYRQEGGFAHERVDGEFYDGPTRKILWQGTEKERTEGKFFDDRLEDDGTEHTAIREWSEGVPLRDLVLPSRYQARMNDGTYVDSDPREMAYQLLVQRLCIQPLARTFIIDGRQGEYAMFCFPMAWGDQENLYLIVTVNARYGDLECFFFQGDVAARAKTKARKGRMHEVEAFLRTRRTTWGPFEAPSRLSITFGAAGPNPPQAVELRDVVQAANALRNLDDGSGQGPWLYSGG